MTECTARKAVFFHSQIERARFVECDFREADFQGFPDTATFGAEFIRCDLRRTNWHGRNLTGVSFVDCKMQGIHGAVAGLEDAAIERADLSSDGDRSHIAAKGEILMHWHHGST
jgi:uncharacterized protein YjbI with pentapeptide repeats